MIPQGRPTITEADIAARVGTPLTTWRRRFAPAFREAVPNLLSGRFVLYDAEQAEAYLAGEPIPSLPQDPHADDLLTDVEVGAILDVAPDSVRSHVAHGYIGKGQKIGGARVWPRRQVDDRLRNSPGREAGGGRPTKAAPYEGDPRLRTAVEALAAQPDTPRRRIAGDLATRHPDTRPHTWERILAAAQQATAQ